MPTYLIEGKKVKTDRPLSDDEIDEIASSIKGTAAAPAPAPQQERPSMGQQMFGLGSPLASFVAGSLVQPALGANQLLAQLPIFPESVRTGATQLARGFEQQQQAAKEQVGRTGFDIPELLGQVVSPVNKLVPVTPAQGTGALPKLIDFTTQAASRGAVQAGLQPVTSEEDFSTTKLQQMGGGAVLGPAVEGSMKLLGGLVGSFRGLTDTGLRQAVKDRLDTLAGSAKEEAIEALRNVTEYVTGSRPTAAEALAKIPSALELGKIQQDLASTTGTAAAFAQREADQALARLKELNKVARTPEERAAIQAQRDTITTQLRNQSFANAGYTSNLVGRLEAEIREKAANLESEARRIAAAGGPGEAGRKQGRALIESQRKQEIDFKKLQLDSLETSGMYPLRAADITNRLDAAIKGTTNDEVRAVLTTIRGKIEDKTDKNGMLSSIDLYENVRKTLNQDILAYLQQAGKPYQGGVPEQLAKTSGNIKNFIDDAMDKASGGLWKDYLNNYTKYSQKLNRMDIGKLLVDKLQVPLKETNLERAGVFAQAVNDAAATIKKSTGLPRYTNLSQILTKDEVNSVNAVLADLTRKDLADRFGRNVRAQAETVEDLAGKVPATLSRTGLAVKQILEFMQKGSPERANRLMAELFLEPAKLAEFMATEVSPSRVDKLAKALYRVMDEGSRRSFSQQFGTMTGGSQ
jgi:hypothetical protein